MARPEGREDLEAPLRGARRYADFLRQELRDAVALPARGVCSARPLLDCAEDEPRLWARSGAMALTGDSVPRLSVGAPASCAEGALDAVCALAGRPPTLAGLSGAALLGERAAALGLRRRGSASPGGSCRLLLASDGTLALNLARPEDVALLPAWLECEGIRPDDDPWIPVREIVRRRPTAALEQRGRLMGLPVAAVPERTPSVPWLRVTPFGDVLRSPERPPQVVDLSSLWAGPLCTHLLQRCGAEVWKVESSKRPDGAHRGERSFYDLLNAHKRSVVLDLETEGGRRQLAVLLAGADIVVESSRPRALRQLGIRAESLLGERPGRVWLSLTGHGREAPRGDWVAFGDDAAASAGLLARPEGTPAGGSDSRSGSPPCFCGDA
ncbi:MAG: CoA transferase, partial [Myxococcota bacterium]